MSPITWAIRPLKRYADFKGRSPRAEYWWFVAFQWLLLILSVLFAFSIAGAAKAGETDALMAGFIIPFAIGVLLLIIPNIAVQVRRLHDQDRSGWMILLFCIPYIGGLIGIVFMCIEGTNGPNRFGPDPYEGDYLEGVFA